MYEEPFRVVVLCRGCGAILSSVSGRMRKCPLCLSSYVKVGDRHYKSCGVFKNKECNCNITDKGV